MAHRGDQTNRRDDNRQWLRDIVAENSDMVEELDAHFAAKCAERDAAEAPVEADAAATEDAEEATVEAEAAEATVEAEAAEATVEAEAAEEPVEAAEEEIEVKNVSRRNRTPVAGTVRMGSLPALPAETERGKSVISVDRRNAADVAAQFFVLGNSPAIVSPASRWKPGGTYDRGGWGGESDLCRRCPQLFDALSAARYPLCAVDTLYTPNVAIARDSRLNIVDWPEVAYAAVISATPVQGKRGDETHKLTHRQRVLMATKVRVAIATAASYGHDVVVLPALGCGAYNLDPVEVSEVFREVLDSPECPRFKHIVFAVPPHGWSGRANADVFEAVFG